MQNGNGADSFQNKTGFLPAQHSGSKTVAQSGNAFILSLLRPSSVKVTDGLCIKDTTTIDGICSTGNSLTNTNDGRVVKVECGNAKYVEVNA